MKESLVEIQKSVPPLVCLYFLSFQINLHNTEKTEMQVFMVGNQCFLHYCGDFSAVTIQLLLPQPCLSFTVIDVELTASLCSQAGEAHAAPRFIFIQV